MSVNTAFLKKLGEAVDAYVDRRKAELVAERTFLRHISASADLPNKRANELLYEKVASDIAKAVLGQQ